jgi:hypothetical protein
MHHSYEAFTDLEEINQSTLTRGILLSQKKIFQCFATRAALRNSPGRVDHTELNGDLEGVGGVIDMLLTIDSLSRTASLIGAD